MKKRMLSLFLVLAMLMPFALGIPASAEIKMADIAEKAGLLQKLGIINSIADEAEGNKEISRAEFVISAAKVLGIDETETATRYFIDVPMDHWAVVCINAMAERGIISQPEDKLFRPFDKITANEALKILVSMCGYGEYAMAAGGYPNGYVQVGRNLEIGIFGSDKAITVYEAYDMIYDAMQANMYEVAGLKNNSLVWEEGNETLLSKYFDVYKISGLVTQAQGVSLYPNKLTGNTTEETARYVQIDEEKYTSDINMYDYLGRRTTVFYVQKDEQDVPDIIYRVSYKKEDNVIEINAEDFDKFENNTIYYESDEKSRTQECKISTGVIVIKNGQLQNENLENIIKINKGTLRLIDMDNDDIFDYIILSEYKNVLVSYINSDEYMIYDNIVRGQSINLDEERRLVFIEDASGAKKNFADIAKESLLTVYESAECIRVVINSDSTSGQIYSTRINEETVEIEVGKSESNRIWYEIDKDYYNTYFADNGSGSVRISTGASITYFLDIYGNIAYIDDPMNDGWKYAYMIKTIFDSEQDKSMMKIFTEDGVMMKAYIAEKATIDGRRIEDHNMLLANLNKETNYGKTSFVTESENGNVVFEEDRVNGQLIRVKINNNSMLTAIDTEKDDLIREDRLSLKRTLDYTTGKAFWYHGNCFGGNTAFYNSATVRFRVPSYRDMQTADDDKFSISSGKYSTTSNSYTIEAFKTDISSAYEGALVVYNKTGSDSGDEQEIPYLVKRILTGINDDNEITKVAELYKMNGGDVVSVISEDSNGFTCKTSGKQMDEGDLVQISVATNGNVTSVRILYNYDEPSGSTFGHLTNSGKWRQSDDYDLAHSYIKTSLDSMLRLVYDRSESNTNWPLREDEMTPETINNCDRMISCEDGTLLIYDGKNVTISTINSGMQAADITGCDNAEDYWLLISYAKVVAGVVYRPAK